MMVYGVMEELSEGVDAGHAQYSLGATKDMFGGD